MKEEIKEQKDLVDIKINPEAVKRKNNVILITKVDKSQKFQSFAKIAEVVIGNLVANSSTKKMETRCQTRSTGS